MLYPMANMAVRANSVKHLELMKELHAGFFLEGTALTPPSSTNSTHSPFKRVSTPPEGKNEYCHGFD
jgi:hypothetical protein